MLFDHIKNKKEDYTMISSRSLFKLLEDDSFNLFKNYNELEDVGNNKIYVDYEFNEDEKLIKALLPGVKKEDFELFMEKGKIHIKILNDINNPFMVLKKDSSYAFSVNFEDSYEYRISGEIKDGILYINAKKNEDKKPKKRMIELD